MKPRLCLEGTNPVNRKASAPRTGCVFQAGNGHPLQHRHSLRTCPIQYLIVVAALSSYVLEGQSMLQDYCPTNIAASTMFESAAEVERPPKNIDKKHQRKETHQYSVRPFRKQRLLPMDDLSLIKVSLCEGVGRFHSPVIQATGATAIFSSRRLCSEEAA